MMASLATILAGCFVVVVLTPTDAKGNRHTPPPCGPSPMHCDENKCLNPGEKCDGKPYCVTGNDGANGLCTKYGKCHGRCLRHAANPSDRMTQGICTVCCMQDKDGDGFITKEEVAQDHDTYCGEDDNGEQNCDIQVLEAIETNNHMPFCHSEIVAYAEFVSALADDGDTNQAVVSRNDLEAMWEEYARPQKTEDGRVPIGQCLAFWTTMRDQIEDPDCELKVSAPES